MRFSFMGTSGEQREQRGIAVWSGDPKCPLRAHQVNVLFDLGSDARAKNVSLGWLQVGSKEAPNSDLL